MKFELERVYYIPKQLKPGVLYVSEEFETAAHLCACGCGEKVRTPLGPTEWSLEVTKTGPTLRPSIGNWQQPCQSHYCIVRGEVIWAGKWTGEQIDAGRWREQKRRLEYFDARERARKGKLHQFIDWIKSMFDH